MFNGRAPDDLAGWYGVQIVGQDPGQVRGRATNFAPPRHVANTSPLSTHRVLRHVSLAHCSHLVALLRA